MKYYGIQINMNEVTKLKYCGFAEGIKDVNTLDEAKDYAMEVYNDLNNGKSGEYLSNSIYRPNEGMCITSVSIHEYDTEDNNYNEFIEGYGFEPYMQ